jgi:hypothetical protein
MKNPIFESMTKLRVGRFVVRIWREEDNLKSACVPNRADLHRLLPTLTSADDVEEMLSLVLAMPRVAAVEVVDEKGDGDGAYASWP